MIYRVEKTWNGFVSVRSLMVHECIKNKEDLTIQYGKEEMTVAFKNLLNPLQLVQRDIKSKFPGGGTYKLYDFKWIPKVNTKKQEALF